MSGKVLEEKQRADEALKKLGLTDSREQAKRLIMAGQVLARFPKARSEELVNKPGRCCRAVLRCFLKRRNGL